MNCPHCRKQIERKWNYCPNCGQGLDRPINLLDIFNEQMQQMKKLFGSGDFNLVEDPGKSITISISHGPGQPRISVQPIRSRIQRIREKRAVKKRKRKQPKLVVEPKADIRRTANNITVNIELPDVKSSDDVDINRFPNSTEIRAYVGDKGYFKIVKIPRNYRMTEKKLEKGNLKLEFTL